MEEGKAVLTPEQKALRVELEDHFLSCPGVVFAGVGGTLGPKGRLVITLGSLRPRLVADLLAEYLPAVQSKLEGLDYSIAIVRGRTES